MQRVGCQFLAPALFGELSEVQDANHVADALNNGEIVGYEEICQPEPLLQIAQEVQDLRPDGHVKG